MSGSHSIERGKRLDELDVKIVFSLADNRMNVCKVARILFMHRNTVSYHIQKIKRITGFDPLNFYDLHKLIKAVKTWQ